MRSADTSVAGKAPPMRILVPASRRSKSIVRSVRLNCENRTLELRNPPSQTRSNISLAAQITSRCHANLARKCVHLQYQR